MLVEFKHEETATAVLDIFFFFREIAFEFEEQPGKGLCLFPYLVKLLLGHSGNLAEVVEECFAVGCSRSSLATMCAIPSG